LRGSKHAPERAGQLPNLLHRHEIFETKPNETARHGNGDLTNTLRTLTKAIEFRVHILHASCVHRERLKQFARQKMTSADSVSKL
jgi:hypothetical protein